MKANSSTYLNVSLSVCAAVFFSLALNAQVSQPLAWRITARDTVSSTHEATEVVTNAITGEVTTNRAHRYVEIGSGLNYRNDAGEWVPSQDLVELSADGGAAAVHGPTKVYFSPNLNAAGAITLVTTSNRVFRTRPLGLFWYNAASGKAVLIAPPLARTPSCKLTWTN